MSGSIVAVGRDRLGVLLGLLQIVRIWGVPVPAVAAQVPIYVMGTVSAYWFVERVLSLAPAVP